MLFITLYGALIGLSRKAKSSERKTGMDPTFAHKLSLMPSYYFPLNEHRQLRTSLGGRIKERKTTTSLSWHPANKAWPNGLFLFGSVTTLSTRGHPSHSGQIATICAIIAVEYGAIIDLFMAFIGANGWEWRRFVKRLYHLQSWYSYHTIIKQFHDQTLILENPKVTQTGC